MSVRRSAITVIWACALPVFVALMGTTVFVHAATTSEEITSRQQDAGALIKAQRIIREFDARIAEWRTERANPATPPARRTWLEDQEKKLLGTRAETEQTVAEAKTRSYDVAHIFNSVRRTIDKAWQRQGTAAGELRMRANAQVDRLEKSYTRAINLSEPNYVTTNAVFARLKVILQLTTREVKGGEFEPSTDP